MDEDEAPGPTGSDRSTGGGGNLFIPRVRQQGGNRRGPDGSSPARLRAALDTTDGGGVFRRIADFQSQWQHEADSTLKVLRSLTDASLAQPIVPGGRTLGFLAWHITGALGVMLGFVGVQIEGPPPGSPTPARAGDIVAAYERAARSVGQELGKWSDERLTEAVSFFGRPLPAGVALEVLIRHQAHHRGQMTVLMRQAGVPVPGVYGPSKEEWTSLGMPARD